MGKVENTPRRGSKQFWPRKRAQKLVPRIRNYPSLDTAKLLGFMGYKAGMTHIMARDNNPNTVNKAKTLRVPVTIIDCPPIKPFSLRFYQKNDHTLLLRSEMFAKNLDKSFKVGKSGAALKEGEFDEVRLVIYTQPKQTGIGKKQPDLLEVAVGGKTPTEQLTKAQELLEKTEISIADTFDEGQWLDIHGVSKGKGFQGPVKRFGVKLRQHKSEKTKRGPGNLGPWTPKRVPPGQVAQAGTMGYFRRTEYNKLLLKIAKADEVNQKGGIKQYGVIKGDCILIKGSIPGAVNRPIVLSTPRRAPKKQNMIEVVTISTSSKQ